jgi:hypothetical protein
VLAGAAAGLASLTRIDGVLLTVAPATAWLVMRPLGGGQLGSFPRALAWGAASAAAFMLVVAPWLLRDIAVFGTPFPSPSGRLLWIRDYNEQFSIGLDITFERYLAWGIPSILFSKLGAGVDVIGRTLGVLGGIFAASFAYGLWINRRDRRLAPVIAYVIVMFVTMVLLFTEHAPKGAFLHSAPAWLPFALPMAVAALGPLASSLGRFWPFLRRAATHRFLEVVGIAGAVVLSLAGGLALLGQWQVRQERLSSAADFLANAAQADDVLLATDTPSLYLLTGLRGVGMPFDPYPVLAQVIDSYGVRWVVVTLDGESSVDPLGLWNGADAVDDEGNRATFLPPEPAFEADGVRIYEIGE